MKGKILILLIIVCGFTSCSREELIGPSGQNGEDITISASLLVETIQTKSGSLITDQEKTLQNTLVMVFKKDKFGKLHDCIGWATGIGNESVLVKTKIGSVKFVAIANAEVSLIADLKNLYDSKMLNYEVLEKKTTSQALNNPENLIKVGEKDLTLTHADDKKPFSIELIHLPARVDIKITVTDKAGRNWEFVPAQYSVDKIRSASDLILIGGSLPPGVSNTQIAVTSLPARSAINGISFYTYEKATRSEPLIVEISGSLNNLDGNSSENKTYTLPINPIYDGVDSKTNGIVHGYAYLVTGKIDATLPGITIDIKVVPMQKLQVDVDYGKGETWD